MNGKRSVFKMEECTSAVPPGSALGLVIFAIFISGLGKGVSSDGAEFAGEPEVCSIVKVSSQHLTIDSWMIKWEIKVSVVDVTYKEKLCLHRPVTPLREVAWGLSVCFFPSISRKIQWN